MTNTQTHKNPRELTQRVLLLAIIGLLFAPCCSTANRTALNSTVNTGNEKGAFIMQQKPKISKRSTCYKSDFVGCPHSQKWITES